MMTTALAPLDLRSGAILGDQVYELIGSAILDGRLPPGHRLRDVDLAAELGVSRTPVREALLRLERFGLVEIAVGRYTRVTVPDDKLREDSDQFATLFLASALRLALVRCDDEELADLVAAADAVAIASAHDDLLRQFDASAELFRLVTLATDNTVFVGVLREASLALQRNLRGRQPVIASSVERRAHYTRLRDCIAARDIDGAERELRRLHGIP